MDNYMHVSNFIKKSLYNKIFLAPNSDHPCGYMKLGLVDQSNIDFTGVYGVCAHVVHDDLQNL